MWGFSLAPPKQIDFGDYTNRISVLNYSYHNIANRLIDFALEAGEDPHDRKFFAEPLITFAILRNMSRKSIDTIYRHYVYSKLAESQEIDLLDLELEDLMMEFKVVL